jgi:HPt (histidine-containing phosphotransfer) domain-containing protein
MDDFLAKPIRMDDILRLLRKWAPLAASRIVADDKPRDPQEAATSPGFDAGRLREVSGGDTAFMAQLIESFLASSHTRIELLRQAVGKGDASAARSIAHTLAGAGLNVGAKGFAEVAASLEQACARADWPLAGQMIDALTGALGSLHERAAELAVH